MKKFFFKSCIFISALTVFLHPVQAEEKALYLPENFSKIRLETKLDIFRDTGGRETINTVLGSSDSKFTENRKESISEGYSPDPIWIRFSMHQDSNLEKRFLILIAYHSLDYVDYFEVDPETRKILKEIHTGDRLPESTKEIFYREFVFETTLKKSEKKLYFVRIQTSGSLSVPISVWDKNSFQFSELREETGHGLYYGLMAAMFLYNLFLLFSLKELSYLFYVGFTGSYTMLQAVGHGHAFQYLWPDSPEWTNTAFAFFIGITIFFANMFADNFLKIKNHLSYLSYILKGSAFAGLLICFFSFRTSTRIINQTALTVGLISIFMILAAGIAAALKKFRPARFFLLAWAMFLFFAAVTVFSMFGLIPVSFLTLYGIQIGSAAETILLSFALADKINLIKKENQDAIDRTIQLQEEATIELESKVQDRTKRIQDFYEHIQKDINMASIIQEKIIPRNFTHPSLKVNSIFLPLDVIGGDIFDIYEISPGRVRFFLADATGHGVQAALITMLIKSEYDGLKYFISDPGDLLFSLQIRFTEGYKGMRIYFSAIVLDIDLNENRIFYSSAGHPPQAVQAEDGIIKLHRTGAIIGIQSTRSYETKETPVRKGDRVFLFTDGLLEVFDEKNSQLGEEGFLRFISEHKNESIALQMHNCLLDMRQFMGIKEPTDDITFLGIEIGETSQ